ncbi:MAG TPA: DNA mismatch repair protein MutS [Candidatus Acidoferrales bacterium]|nr:DNA mismatch repair protein MutS [Candidatus Acidoferrales bacterium]
MTEPTTPLLRQYHAIKQRYPHALLLFRLGDFYELFYEDALAASRELQITLTSRNREAGQAVPMCGVPYHAAETYIARLVRAGYKVAVCEQMEEPSRAKKLVRREVIRVITPGTATDFPLLEPKENNYLAAVARDASARVIGLAAVDVSTGEFSATEFSGDDAELRLREALELVRPREVLLPRPATLFAAVRDTDGSGAVETRVDEWVFRPDYGSRLLAEQFAVATLDGFGLENHPQAVAAAGALVHYLRETSAVGGGRLEHLDRIRFYHDRDALVLDDATVRNLELVAPLYPGQPEATLLASLDETSTGMGARLLRSWILRPSIDRREIEARLDAVSELAGSTVLREELRKDLAGILDLERLTSRVTLGVATPRDLVALRHSLARLPLVRGFLGRCSSPRLAELREQLDDLADVCERVERAIADDPPAQPSEPGVIRKGYDAQLDELRDLSQHAKQTIAQMEERERKRTGIGSLKIRFNQVFGYSIEVSKPNLHLVPPDYERKQTLVGAERYISPELKEYERKVLDADRRILEIERRLFAELRGWVAGHAQRLRRTAGAIARIDVLATFARLAAARNYVRPVLHDSEELCIVGGRHPVLELLLERRGERFVPNELYLDRASQAILLITGPNMGGKSTYLRQAGLIVLLAQIGCYVPAAEARLPITDRIFTRIGAADNLGRGRSTFLVEMSEVAAILNGASESSLVLLDEVGRGTATFDGLAIAWAVVEALEADPRPRTLFATHYHELTELADRLEAVKNLHVAVRESGQQIVFLHRVEPGGADKSYGIEVARLAGLPPAVIDRAREVLRRHEQSEHQLTAKLSPGAADQPPIFTPLDRRIVEALRALDPDSLRPIDALALLAELKKQIS